MQTLLKHDIYVNYFIAREKEDPFVYNALSDPFHMNQREALLAVTRKMLQDTEDSHLPHKPCDKLQSIVVQQRDLFRIALSAGPSTKLKPFKIYLELRANLLRVRLRYLSQEQRVFLNKFS